MTNIFKLAIIFINLLLIFPVEKSNSEIDYFSLGYEKGCYYQEICEQFFYSGSALRWVINEEENQFLDNQTDRMFIPVTGYKKNNEIINTNYNGLKQTLIHMGISEHAFRQFQQNASRAYYEFDSKLYM